MESNRRGLGSKASSNGNQYAEGSKGTKFFGIFGMLQLRKKGKRVAYYLLAFGVSFLLGIFMVRELLGGLTVHQNAVVGVKTDLPGVESGMLGMERETSLPQAGSYLTSTGEVLGGVNAPEGFYLTPEDLYPVEVSLKDASAKVTDLVNAKNRISLKPNLLPSLEDKQENLHGSNDKIETETGWGNVSKLVLARNLVEVGNSPKAELFPSGKLNRPRLKVGSRSNESNGKLNDGQCVNFTLPFGEYERVGDSQERGRWLGIDFKSFLMDNKVPEWCPELAISRAEPCVWGPGLLRARILEKATFFIRVSGPTIYCYTRATGAGVILPQITNLRQNIMRVDYVPQQEGEYKLWVMCDSVVFEKLSNDRPLPDESTVPPWFHQYTTLHSPYNLVVEPNPNILPRGCEPCDGPSLGELSGQWVQRDLLICQCGREALGAVAEWFVDDYIWAPRTCVIPFRKRADFFERFKGKAFALAGDESVRGHFVDFANWLNGVGPEILQDPNGYKMSEDFSSPWDGWIPGFNKKPFEEDIDLLFPNPITVGQVKISFFPVGKSELWISTMASIMKGEDPSLPIYLRTNETSEKPEKLQLYDALVFSFGTWYGNLLSVPPKYSEDDGIGAEVRGIIKFLKCPKGTQRWCVGPFKGRMVYRSNTGRFDRENFCARPKVGANPALGKACSINSVVTKMIRNDFKTGADGDLFFLDALNITFSRPDRSIDGMFFYPHKCVFKGVPCAFTTKEVQDCCWDPNLFPHVGSLTLTHMIVNMLWDDPLIFGSDGGKGNELEEGSTTRKSRRLLTEDLSITRENMALISKEQLTVNPTAVKD